MPVFAIIHEQVGPERTDYYTRRLVRRRIFLWVVAEQSGFKNLLGRMGADHKPNVLRIFNKTTCRHPTMMKSGRGRAILGLVLLRWLPIQMQPSQRAQSGLILRFGR
jgi:hypothetical protein